MSKHKRKELQNKTDNMNNTRSNQNVTMMSFV